MLQEVWDMVGTMLGLDTEINVLVPNSFEQFKLLFILGKKINKLLINTFYSNNFFLKIYWINGIYGSWMDQSNFLFYTINK